jgi:hypothetical protein
MAEDQWFALSLPPLAFFDQQEAGNTQCYQNQFA